MGADECEKREEKKKSPNGVSYRNRWHKGKTGSSSLFPATKSFSPPIFHRQRPNSFNISNYTQLNQQKLHLLTPKTPTHWEETGRVGTRLLSTGICLQFGAISIPIPPPCPAPPLLIRTTTPSQRLIPAATLPKHAMKKTNDNGGAPLASVVQLFASFLILF